MVRSFEDSGSTSISIGLLMSPDSLEYKSALLIAPSDSSSLSNFGRAISYLSVCSVLLGAHPRAHLLGPSSSFASGFFLFWFLSLVASKIRIHWIISGRTLPNQSCHRGLESAGAVRADAPD
ncbi:hypothetical protein NL676_008201 [Syzygium grande]|nr:hypothetical protein NL676_008201 [Syzygium grande]